MKLTIISYEAKDDYHVCKDESGVYHKLDLFSDSSFPEGEKMFNEDIRDDRLRVGKLLIGKTIEVDRTFPYIYFASNIKLI